MIIASLKAAVVIAACGIMFVACRKNIATEQSVSPSPEALAKIHALGFSNKNVAMDEEGNYVVEGDILLSQADLNASPDMQFVRVGAEEQYRTYNLVTALPRVIKVSVSSTLPSAYKAALDEAIARYNKLKLKITFKRVSSKADISITNATGNFLASAGFPQGGNPYSQVKVNAGIMEGQPQAMIASVLAHEIGHCIGFRHTDYMNRSYSCGGEVVNEGASSEGAVFIPGTNANPDPDSWMLSCISYGQNRPFNANDKKALDYLY